MQRVLSFQMGRGVGETSEFVTKRMCFSFLISVAFLSILGGFLIGKFATGRVFELRAEKIKIQFNGNGLEKNDFMRIELIQHLREDFKTIPSISDLTSSKALESVEQALSGLNIFNKVTGNDSCVVATVHGSHESDRYVVLGANGDNIAVALPIARQLQRIYSDHAWVPRRTFIFLMYSGSMEPCLYSLSDYERSKIIACLIIDEKPIKGDGVFLTSGSDIVQTTVLEASRDILKPAAMSRNLPRLKLALPQTRISFHAAENSTKFPTDVQQSQKNIVAEVLGTSLWRLSEMMVFQWDPELLKNVNIILNQLNLPDNQILIDKIKATIERIISAGILLNEKINNIDRQQSLTVRMMNDFLKSLEMALLCPDNNLQSKTDVTLLQQLSNHDNINNYLENMLICYENADKILQDMT